MGVEGKLVGMKKKRKKKIFYSWLSAGKPELEAAGGLEAVSDGCGTKCLKLRHPSPSHLFHF